MSRTGFVAGVVIALDQVTKSLIRADMPLGDSSRVTSFLDIVHIRNDGVAFSAFEGKPGLVIALLVVAIAALLWYFARHAEQPFVWLATGLVIGGALGNLIDRVFEGAVTDFIKFSHWPAFNVADIAINLGVVVLLLVLFAEERRRGAATK
jgi:signal peptidase II